MIDVDNVVALVGATEKPDKLQIQREMASHAQLKFVERPTPDVNVSLTEPKHAHIVIDIDAWTMDDYIALMEIQESKNVKETIVGMRRLLSVVVKDWSFVDANGEKIPVSEVGMGKLKPREWNEVSSEVLKLAQTSFLS